MLHLQDCAINDYTLLLILNSLRRMSHDLQSLNLSKNELS